MYTSLFWILVGKLVAEFGEWLVVWIALLGLATMFGSKAAQGFHKSTSKGLGRVLEALIGAAFAVLFWVVQVAYRIGRGWALALLSRNLPAGARPRRWQVDWLGGVFAALLLAATYLLVFHPWVPVSWAGGAFPSAGAPSAPGGGGASAPVPPSRPRHEQLAHELDDCLERALGRGMGGIEIRPNGYTADEIKDAVRLLRSGGAGVPQREVEPSTRLKGFLRICPLGGPGGNPVQDIL